MIQAMMTVLPVLLFGGFFAWYYVTMTKKRDRLNRDAGETFRGFLEETGYRVAILAGAPIEEHARVALAAQTAMGGPGGQEWVRNCGGVQIRHFFRAVTQNNTNYLWCRWTAPLVRPPRFGGTACIR